jgi:hypothetical protein
LRRAAYEADLRKGINRFRWIEYSISSTIMVLLIASYSGITDLTALIGITGANVAMILFGWLQERFNHPAALRRQCCLSGSVRWPEQFLGSPFGST